MALPRRNRLPPHDPATFQNLFSGESDRAAAVLGGSYLEGVLEQVLRSWMPPDSEKTVDDFFGHQGFLGAFGARKNMAFALGIVDAETRNDLQHIASIRNFFAHHVLEASSFDAQPVREELAKISFHPYPPEWNAARDVKPLIEKWKQASPREFFLAAVELLASRIRLLRVGPGTGSWNHFRDTIEVAIMCRADRKFTRYVLREWSELDGTQVTLPDAFSD